MKISYNGAFGEWLARQLIERKMTVTEFAKDFGISRQHIHKHLGGKAHPHKSTLIMYAKYFSTDLKSLIDLIHIDGAEYK